jgi:hypothetical protein
VLTFPEHPSSHSVFSWVCVAYSLVFCLVFCRSLFLAIVLPVFQIKDSDSPFGIFKLFLDQQSYEVILH